MTNAEIDRLLALEAEATPGPWQEDGNACYIFAGIMTVCQIRGWGYLTGTGGMNLAEDKALAIQKANSRFIVAARSALKPLALEVTRLRQEIKRLNEVYAKAAADKAALEGL